MTAGLRHWGAADAPAVLLLHATLAHGGAWKGVAERLADRFHLIAPDMVGHGRGPAGDRTRDYHDQATEHVAGLLPDAPVHLVGHSFGATIALRLAMEHSPRVLSLTLVEPVLFAAAPDSPEKRANAERLGAMSRMVAEGDSRGAARDFLSTWGAGEDFDALPEAQAARMADRMWIIGAQRAALHRDGARLLPRLADVSCRVLLMRGTASPPVIGQILDGLQDGLHRVRRAVIHGAGHMAPITHPDLVAEEIGAFLDTAR
ncbi:MAG: alpha/beta fold hydrolase [Roseicyclus sp.]